MPWLVRCVACCDDRRRLGEQGVELADEHVLVDHHQGDPVKGAHQRRQELSVLGISSFGQLVEAAETYRRGHPVAVHVLSEDLAQRAADFLSGLAYVSLGDLRRINGAKWLLRPRALRFSAVQIHEKRHRGPRPLWPLGSAAVGATRHLPHWARRFYDAVDRAFFTTEIIIAPPDPPPPSGVREPRRPSPGRPSAALSLDEPDGGHTTTATS